LNVPLIKHLGLINHLINRPNKPSPFKCPKQHPINYLGPFLKCFNTILKSPQPEI
jgi:hypothetical protein